MPPGAGRGQSLVLSRSLIHTRSDKTIVFDSPAGRTSPAERKSLSLRRDEDGMALAENRAAKHAPEKKVTAD